jgi:hypothetical protein
MAGGCIREWTRSVRPALTEKAQNIILRWRLQHFWTSKISTPAVWYLPKRLDYSSCSCHAGDGTAAPMESTTACPELVDGCCHSSLCGKTTTPTTTDHSINLLFLLQQSSTAASSLVVTKIGDTILCHRRLGGDYGCARGHGGWVYVPTITIMTKASSHQFACPRQLFCFGFALF